MQKKVIRQRQLHRLVNRELQQIYILPIRVKNKKMISSNSLQDEMLKAYIQSVFNTYDTDRNGSLDVKQMTCFFNDLFQKLNIGVVVTQAQSFQAIQSIDQNSDGLVDRQQLLKAFKMMLAPKKNPPPQQQNYGQGYNQYGNNMYNNQPGYNQQGFSNNQGYNPQGNNPQGYGYNNNNYGQNYPNQGGFNNYQNPGMNYGQNYNPNPIYNTQPNQFRPNQMHSTQPYQQNYNPYR